MFMRNKHIELQTYNKKGENMKLEGYTNNYTGLTTLEVEKSIISHGKNILRPQKKKTWFTKLFEVLKEPMFLLLITTALIYFLLGEYQDGFIMFIFVFFVSGIEIFQEWKTDKAMHSLKMLVSLNTKVIRNSKIQDIQSEDIVVGDIIILEEGDQISADADILECHDLGIDESILTGESDIVYKNTSSPQKNILFQMNKCYSGTSVVSGSAILRVTAVGRQTEYGKIAYALQQIQKEKTPLEKQVKKLIQICAVISLLFCLSVIVTTFVMNINQDLFIDRLIHSLLAGITVAMATIPEEIPVILTVFLAMGAWKLVKKNTLVRNMSTVETLGAVSVLCVDKTGTLTKNEMEIKETFGDQNLIYYATLACETDPYDPMEKAILKYAEAYNISNIGGDLIYEYPFQAKQKMMGHIWRIENKTILVVKGAYETVLPLCQITELSETYQKAHIYSKQEYRVIAVAYSYIDTISESITDQQLDFVGLLAFIDPPREDIYDSIQLCKQAGIRIIMITGDNGDTAQGIAQQIGMGKNLEVVTGAEIEQMTDLELQEKVRTSNIYARVYPNHKMRIVEALQKNSEVVAMTGDGVNDATALKKAEIGIAMGKRGTNVAKEASDLILLDDRFHTIVETVENGRRIYQNIRKAICYVFVIHIPIACLSLFVPLLNLPALLLPIHIVLLELIIDPTSSIVFERFSTDQVIMKEQPRKLDEPLISKDLLWKSIIQGLVIFIMVLGSYIILLQEHTSSYAATCSLSILILSNILLVYVNQSNQLTVINMVKTLKDIPTLGIHVIILISLLVLIYVPSMSHVVGFCALPLSTLFGVIVMSVVSTAWYDLVKICSKYIANKKSI